jgi:hypothetical protein
VSLFPHATDLYLVHVAPAIEITIDGWYDLTYARVAREGFARLVRTLEGCGARIQTVELIGNRERELTRFVRGINADLVVVGSYKRGLFRRLASGTVAMRVLRACSSPVLIVPEPAEVPLTLPPDAKLRMTELAERVSTITSRNVGRRALVEVDTPGIGAQSLAFDYCFLGMDYDHRDDRVHIYLGDAVGKGDRHVTHSIPSPTRVDVLRGLDGQDQVVRVADGIGHALVTFI